MESFDESLKHLLHQAPEDFIHFGLQSTEAQVMGPQSVTLPSRGRNVDGIYLLEQGGTRLVVHLEFHRRHQSLEELALDVAEAQVRLFRRDRLRVLTYVWDLYGSKDEPLLQERVLHYGAPEDQAHSVCVYRRVNLRALSWHELRSAGYPGLLPLAPLTRDGVSVEVVREARAAIEAQPGLTEGQLADRLAVLSFIAEAEGVPAQELRYYIPKEQLMTSTLYQEILAEGEAQGVAKGVAQGVAQGVTQGVTQGVAQTMKDTVLGVLTSHLGEVEPRVREQVQALAPGETLKQWYKEALAAVNAGAAQKLAQKITQAA